LILLEGRLAFDWAIRLAAAIFMPIPLRSQPLLPLELPTPAQAWIERLGGGLDDPSRTSGFLEQAEEALEACPKHPGILLLATVSALLDQKPEKAFAFLKRLRKLYQRTRADYLLEALALFQTNKSDAARALLERHAMTNWTDAWRVFPVGQARFRWLADQVNGIMGRLDPYRRTRRVKTQIAKTRPATQPRKRDHPARLSPAPRTEPASSPRGLPKIAIEIPFTIEFDLSPLASTINRGPERDGRWWQLRERFAHLGLAQGFDELLCLPQLTGVEPLWHQIETVRKVLKQFHGRVLLADEVGLGKTIEAGMVLKEYLVRGMAERVLVLTPAALVGQWKEELETKFGISSATTQDALSRDDPDAFWSQKRIVASISTARRQDHAERMRGHNFDLVIVDEAHHLRDRSSQSWKLVDALNKRFLLLLSATPVQNNLLELYNLLTLLKPGIFKTQKEFRSAYMTPGNPRRPAHPQRLRELMRGAMIRNTRAVVALKLPRRHALTIKVDAGAEEQQAYADLVEAARAISTESGRHGMALQHLLSAAGSSPAAAAASLARFAARHPDTGWQRLAQHWAAIRSGGKESALIELLERNPLEKKLVFVHSRETLTRVAELLAARDMVFARFDGSLNPTAKDAAIGEFRDRFPVLLSTESGGEGRNIQFCNTLINFDVPWNPMAIEQRIGRIDRIGQTREVFIFNLVTRGTVEEQVLILLDEKISMFELVVGEVGAILGGLEEERDFSTLVLDAWLHATETERAEAFRSIGRQLDEARAQHEGAKVLDEALFGQDFEPA
jgi:superfamily II DNA or RNA helicase